MIPTCWLLCHFRGHGVRCNYKLVQRGYYLGHRNVSSRPPPRERPPKRPRPLRPALATTSSLPVALANYCRRVRRARRRNSSAADVPLPHSRPLVHGGTPASLQLPPATPGAAQSVETTSSVNRPAALSASSSYLWRMKNSYLKIVQFLMF